MNADVELVRIQPERDPLLKHLGSFVRASATLTRRPDGGRVVMVTDVHIDGDTQGIGHLWILLPSTRWMIEIGTRFRFSGKVDVYCREDGSRSVGIRNIRFLV